MLSSFSKLASFFSFSLFFLSDLTQTGDSIYFLSGGVYSLGYSLALGLFGKECHLAPLSSSSLHHTHTPPRSVCWYLIPTAGIL